MWSLRSTLRRHICPCKWPHVWYPLTVSYFCSWRSYRCTKRSEMQQCTKNFNHSNHWYVIELGFRLWIVNPWYCLTHYPFPYYSGLAYHLLLILGGRQSGVSLKPYQRLRLFHGARNCTLIAQYWWVPGINLSMN